MDLLLTEDGDFAIGAWGDISNVSELEQIIQHIIMALLTWRGEIALHPTFGSNIYQIVGQINDEYLEPKASIFVQEALEFVPHVSRVTAVRLFEDDIDPNTYQLKIVVAIDLYGKEKQVLINIPATT